jgi:hypothetical protein
MVVGSAVMLSTGSEGGWHVVDTVFLAGMLLAFSGALWWEHRKDQLDLMRSSVSLAAVLVYVWLMGFVWEYNETLAFVTLAVLFLAVVGWRAWRASQQDHADDSGADDSGQVPGADRSGS